MMKKILIPFEELKNYTKSTLISIWLVFIISFWTISSLGNTHIFPSPKQVLIGLNELWYDGLITHLFSSISLCVISVAISVLISLTFAYSSTIPLFKPIGTFITKIRYLPLTGISFYISILINDARSIQVWVLVVFMTTFLTTSLIQMIGDIPEEEFNHARTLGCNRWEILLEVVIKGRLDYVIELIRQNLAIVWVFVVTVESILVAAGGLGLLIKNNDKLGDSGKVIALQIIIIIIGIIFDFFITKIRKIIFKYSNW